MHHPVPKIMMVMRVPKIDEVLVASITLTTRAVRFSIAIVRVHFSHKSTFSSPFLAPMDSAKIRLTSIEGVRTFYSSVSFLLGECRPKIACVCDP
jgi:hypothetical protein